MFTAPEFSMIRNHCPKDLNLLLENLSIPIPNFDSEPEFKIYEHLDKAIKRGVCKEMKSITPVTGYIKMLKMAGVAGDENADDEALITAILENEAKILKTAEKNVPKIPPSLEKSLITYQTEIILAPIVFGAIFSIMTFFYTMLADMYFPAVTVIGTIAGLGCIIFGLRGEQRMKLVKPPEYFVKPLRDRLTKAEATKALETFKLIKKVYTNMRPKSEQPTVNVAA